MTDQIKCMRPEYHRDTEDWTHTGTWHWIVFGSINGTFSIEIEQLMPCASNILCSIWRVLLSSEQHSLFYLDRTSHTSSEQHSLFYLERTSHIRSEHHSLFYLESTSHISSEHHSLFWNRNNVHENKAPTWTDLLCVANPALGRDRW